MRYLDGLRALAALWVVCNHVWLTIYPTVGDPGPHGLLGAVTSWMIFGHFAVVAFIVLSGYSLAISSARNENRIRGGFGRFVRRRFVRIVLPYWGALLISLALALTVLGSDTGTHWDGALPITGRGVLLHLLLLQDVADTGQINHALWSIALEWHLYFLFPVLLWLRRRVELLPATAGVVALGVAVSSRFDGGLTAWTEANLLGCFALGMAAREIVHRGVRVPGRALAVALVTTFLLITHDYGTIRAAEQSNTVLEPLAGLATAALLISLSQHRDGWGHRLLGHRFLAWIGTFSFSVYLLHAPLLQLLWQYLMRPLRLPLHDGYALFILLGLGIPSSLVAGRLYFGLVERHCLGLHPQTVDSRGTGTGQS